MLHKIYGVIFLLLVGIAPIYAEEAPEENKNYQVSIAPYAWFTSMSGNTTVSGVSAPVDIGFSDIKDRIDFAGFISADISYKNKFGVIVDFNTATIADEKSHGVATLGGETRIRMADVAAYYRVGSFNLSETSSCQMDIDLLAGLRFWDVKLQLNLTTPLINRSFYGQQKWTDPFIGLRANIALGDKWKLRFRGSYGGLSDTEKAWDIGAYVGYSFTKNFSVVTGYKSVSVDRRQENEGFVFDMTIKGPVLGVMVTF